MAWIWTRRPAAIASAVSWQRSSGEERSGVVETREQLAFRVREHRFDVERPALETFGDASEQRVDAVARDGGDRRSVREPVDESVAGVRSENVGLVQRDKTRDLRR